MNQSIGGERLSRNQKLLKASDYVREMWVPINTRQVNRIKSLLGAGDTAPDIGSVLTEIKGDPGFFLHFIREICQLMNSDMGWEQTLTKSGVDTVRKLVTVDIEKLSKHSLSAASDVQMSRFEEILVSAATVESLCEEYLIDPNLGYSAAILRQLGLLLVACNYPKIYRDASKEITPDVSIDQALARRLGFTPSALALRVTRDWSLPEELREAIEDREQDIELASLGESHEKGRAGALTTLCRVGEELARARQPNIYPDSERAWEQSVTAIRMRLGEEGIRRIGERFDFYRALLTRSIPEASAQIKTDGLTTGISDANKSLIRAGATLGWMKDCSANFIHEMQIISSAISNGASTSELLMMWRKSLLPSSGFDAGVVFSFEPVLRALIPQLQFGYIRSRDIKPVALDREIDIVSRAFQAHNPIVRENRTEDGDLVSTISGFFGAPLRLGVVMVESSKDNYLRMPTTSLAHLRGLTHLLSQCLMARG
jgi:hypothetical protein